MPKFIQFRDAVNLKVKELEDSKAGLFLSHVNKSEIWNTYLGAFPEGTDPIFIENTVHNCNCCRDFICDLGRAVSIDDKNNIVTIWDIKIEDEVYQGVADALAAYVRKQNIASVYSATSLSLNTKENRSLDPAKLEKFSHFYYKLSSKYAPSNNAGAIIGNSQRDFNVLKRGLTELTVDALQTVVDLIESNSLYLGEQNLRKVQEFLVIKKQFDKVAAKKRDNFIWLNTKKHESVVLLRNSAIGTLIINLSQGVELEAAVNAFEKIVAPDNYKRSKAVVSTKMIKDAQAKVLELGLEDSLERRHASLEDITINNVIWTDEKTAAKLNHSVFDYLFATTESKKPTKGIDIGLLEFIDKVVPTAKSIQVYLENKHNGNMVSLVSPVHKDAPNLMKWDNNFSWSYNGNMTDSVKTRVANKGGNVEGDLRVSLSWFNSDDLDLALGLPKHGRVYFNNKREGGFELDVDMNVRTGSTNSTSAVENISAQNISDIKEGTYEVQVTNFNKRNTDNLGYEIEIEYLGEITTYSSKTSPADGRREEAVSFKFTREGGVVFGNSKLTKGGRSSEFWGLNTNQFHNVSSVMFSPNHWDNNSKGNRHLFFMLDNCINPEPVRGFYNEYLIESLHDNRKVFEVLAGKMKAEPTEDQLSGLGFSTTKRGDVIQLLVEGTKGKTLYNVVS